MTQAGQEQADKNDVRMYWIHALTPLHVGSGRGVGFIDLPIIREKLTNWPLVPGTAFKGVLADRHAVTDDSRKNDPKHRAAFGRADGPGESSNSGSLVFTDARIVCLPVRSLYGTFAWCTSAIALSRLHRDLTWAGMSDGLRPPGAAKMEALIAMPVPQAETVGSTAQPPETSLLCGGGSKIYLEDLDFNARRDAHVELWGEMIAKSVFSDESEWQKEFVRRFVLLPDDVFNFLSETATQVDARVRIDDETKTVVKGQLWYEESLPSETILAGLVWCGPIFGAKNGGLTSIGLLNDFCDIDKPLNLQIGGKATVGRGQVRATFSAMTATRKGD